VEQSNALLHTITSLLSSAIKMKIPLVLFIL